MKQRANRKKWKLWVVYGTFVLVCLLVALFGLRYIHRVILEYDRAQPERPLSAAVTEVKKKAAIGDAPAFASFPLLGSDKYDKTANRSTKEDFIKKIADAQSLTTQPLRTTAEGETLEKVYVLFADGEKVATVTLTGKNSRNRLFFFSMADWSVTSLSPIVSATLYDITVMLPENLVGFVNGIQIDDSETEENESGVRYCALKGLLQAPEVRVERPDGTEVGCVSQNGVFYPIQYQYSLTLPSFLKVTLNGQELNGQMVEDDMIRYSVAEMLKPELLISDPSGYSFAYEGQSSVPLYQYSVTLPSNFVLQIGDYTPSFLPESFVEHQDAKNLSAYEQIQLPGTVRYEFKLLNEKARLTVIDNRGKKQYYSPETRFLEILDQSTTSVQPAFENVPDPLMMAQTWSHFMSKDYWNETKNGFYHMAKYLVKDSEYYTYAYKWATGIDITFTWGHTDDGFTDIVVDSFVKYSETCFSCHVAFVKHMTVLRDGKKVLPREDYFDSIMYFIYIDDTPDNGADDPHWAIALMRDVVKEVG